MEVPKEAVIEALAQQVARLVYEKAVLQVQVAQLQAPPLTKESDAEAG